MEECDVYWLIEKQAGADVEEGVYLENNGNIRLIVNASTEMNGTKGETTSHLVEAQECVLLASLKRMDLNKSPTIYCTLFEASTAGNERIGDFRIPVKQKILRKSPLLDESRGGYVYPLQLIQSEGSDLTELERHAKKLKQEDKDSSPFEHIQLNDPDALAQLSDDIDLHASQLVDDPEHLERAEILDIQMRSFRKYLEKALRLGKDRVYIIHGVGKGTLRNRIHQALREHPFVDSFDDEYHPKYGHGATEVIFS